MEQSVTSTMVTEPVGERHQAGTENALFLTARRLRDVMINPALFTYLLTYSRTKNIKNYKTIKR